MNSFREKFEIASTQFGGMLGAGIASGATVTLYFIQPGGYMAVFASVLSLVLLFTLYYLGMETCRLYNLNSNTQLYGLFYGNSKAKRVLTILSDITVFYMMIFSCAMAFGGAGSILKEYCNAPSIVGGIIAAVICLGMIYFGLEVFKKLQSFICLIMFFVLFISYIAALINSGGGLLLNKISLRWMPESASIGKTIWWTLSFTALYIGFMPLLIVAGKPLNTRKSIKEMLCIGFILNLAAVFLPCLALLAFAPESIQASIPSAFVVDKGGIPSATLVYLILLTFALLSTGASCLVTIGIQLSPFLQKKFHIKSTDKANNIIYVIFAALFIFCAQLGLSGSLKVFSPIANVLCIVALGIPLGIIAPLKIKQFKKGVKNENE